MSEYSLLGNQDFLTKLKNSLVNDPRIPLESTAADHGDALNVALLSCNDKSSSLIKDAFVRVLGSMGSVKLSLKCRLKLYEVLTDLPKQVKKESRTIDIRRRIAKQTTFEQVEKLFQEQPIYFVEGVRCVQYQKCDFCRMVVATARALGDVDVHVVNDCYGGRWGHKDSYEGRTLDKKRCCLQATAHQAIAGAEGFYKPVYNFKFEKIRQMSESLTQVDNQPSKDIESEPVDEEVSAIMLDIAESGPSYNPVSPVQAVAASDDHNDRVKLVGVRHSPEKISEIKEKVIAVPSEADVMEIVVVAKPARR
jgi:hypothetical protein